jgi:hypothetical protein
MFFNESLSEFEIPVDPPGVSDVLVVKIEFIVGYFPGIVISYLCLSIRQIRFLQGSLCEEPDELH